MSPRKPKRVALYLRVSTSEQTTRNQRRELHAVSERHGWSVVATYEDAGISGAKGRDERPGFDRLMVAVARREIDMVAAWSVDRLGRSLTDLLGFLTDLHAKGVDLFLHQQGLDTSTPSGRAMFQMLGVFAEFERAMIRERVMAGLARARADGKQLPRPLGASCPWGSASLVRCNWRAPPRAVHAAQPWSASAALAYSGPFENPRERCGQKGPRSEPRPSRGECRYGTVATVAHDRALRESGWKERPSL